MKIPPIGPTMLRGIEIAGIATAPVRPLLRGSAYPVPLWLALSRPSVADAAEPIMTWLFLWDGC